MELQYKLGKLIVYLLYNLLLILILTRSIVPPLVFFHATKPLIDFIKRPDVQVLEAAGELLLLVEEIHGDAANGKLESILFKQENDVNAQPGFNWDLAVLQVSEVAPPVYVDVVREVDFLHNLGVYQFFTAMVQGALDLDFPGSVVAYGEPQYVVVALERGEGAAEVAEWTLYLLELLIFETRRPRIMIALKPISNALINLNLMIMLLLLIPLLIILDIIVLLHLLN